MAAALPFVGYILTKALAYSAWCFVGLSWFAPERPARVRGAILFGLGRLVLGIVLGLGIYVAALSMNNATRNAPFTYVVVYVPVRLGEWLLWYFMLRTHSGGRRAVIWVVGGIIVSCLADIPLGMIEGGVVPVGRPFC